MYTELIMKINVIIQFIWYELDLVNEQCETEMNSWQELFPDLQDVQESTSSSSSAAVVDGMNVDM